VQSGRASRQVVLAWARVRAATTRTFCVRTRLSGTRRSRHDRHCRRRHFSPGRRGGGSRLDPIGRNFRHGDQGQRSRESLQRITLAPESTIRRLRDRSDGTGALRTTSGDMTARGLQRAWSRLGYADEIGATITWRSGGRLHSLLAEFRRRRPTSRRRVALTISSETSLATKIDNAMPKIKRSGISAVRAVPCSARGTAFCVAHAAGDGDARVYVHDVLLLRPGHDADSHVDCERVRPAHGPPPAVVSRSHAVFVPERHVDDGARLTEGIQPVRRVTPRRRRP
jgi:hypothetical protein